MLVLILERAALNWILLLRRRLDGPALGLVLEGAAFDRVLLGPHWFHLSAVMPPWRELFFRGSGGGSAGSLIASVWLRRAEKLLPKRCILRRNLFMLDAYPPGRRANRVRAPGRLQGLEVDLSVQPPLPPMLARLARELPGDGFLYEPKWDGFRCLAFRSGDEIDLRSRHDRPLGRYFPELVGAFAALAADRLVLDGEIVVAGPDGFDFAALLARLHPAASRVARLAEETPATFVAFDLLARKGEQLAGRPFRARRAVLEEALAGATPPLVVTPLTDDPRTASRWLESPRDGIDGVVAKHALGAYEPGARAMVKVKTERTADCVVAGFRIYEDRPLPSSLLLGLHDDEGALRHVGIASSFGERQGERLLADMRPLAVDLGGHPWEHGFLTAGSPMGRLKGAAARWVPEMGLDWVPVRPERVCEVAYDHVDRDRFRHPARFRRWRPDREPGSCTFDQLETEPLRLEEVLASA